MISIDQIKEISKKLDTNEAVVAREYVQLTVLKELYALRFSQNVYFKGGTAVRLVYGGIRFSEDLDFTFTAGEDEFIQGFNNAAQVLTKNYPYFIKEKKTLTGKTYLLTATINGLLAPSYVRLDFSMRENVLEPAKVPLKTDYPVIMQNFIMCLSIDEILSEKIRAIMTRAKHRDLYDMWLLLEKGAKLNEKLIDNKLSYYNEVFDKEKLINSLAKFDKEEFIKDLRPFVSIKDRDLLGDFFDYVKAYLLENLWK